MLCRVVGSFKQREALTSASTSIRPIITDTESTTINPEDHDSLSIRIAHILAHAQSHAHKMISETVLLVVIQKGQIVTNDIYFFGPFSIRGVFLKVRVKSVRVNNVSVETAYRGQTATITLAGIEQIPATSDRSRNSENDSSEPQNNLSTPTKTYTSSSLQLFSPVKTSSHSHTNINNVKSMSQQKAASTVPSPLRLPSPLMPVLRRGRSNSLPVIYVHNKDDEDDDNNDNDNDEIQTTDNIMNSNISKVLQFTRPSSVPLETTTTVTAADMTTATMTTPQKKSGSSEDSAVELTMNMIMNKNTDNNTPQSPVHVNSNHRPRSISDMESKQTMSPHSPRTTTTYTSSSVFKNTLDSIVEHGQGQGQGQRNKSKEKNNTTTTTASATASMTNKYLKRRPLNGLVLLQATNMNTSMSDLSTLAESESEPEGCWEFEAEILILNHPSKIQVNYEPVIMIDSIEQSARIIAIHIPSSSSASSTITTISSSSSTLTSVPAVAVQPTPSHVPPAVAVQPTPPHVPPASTNTSSSSSLKTGSKAICHFRFLYHPEYIVHGSSLLMREGRTRGVGTISRVFPNIFSQHNHNNHSHNHSHVI